MFWFWVIVITIIILNPILLGALVAAVYMIVAPFFIYSYWGDGAYLTAIGLSIGWVGLAIATLNADL